MRMEYKVIDGPVERAQRVLLYGPEGIGKSTLASQMPDPVFIDVEDGTSALYCRRLQQPRDWAELLDEVRFARRMDGACSVVIDTADAAERMCQRHVCRQKQISGIEDIGYGKGYVYARDEFAKLLDELDACVADGINAVVICHSTMRKFEQPDEMGAYDRYELKLDKRVAALVKEWADAVLFMNYKTVVATTADGKAKARGGRRTIYTDHRPAWDAKNRWGLPDEVALDAGGVAQVCSHMHVRADRRRPEPATIPEPEPEPTVPTGEEAAEAAKPASEMDVGELKVEQARREACPDYLRPLLDRMAEDHVTIAQMEALETWKGNVEEGQPFEQWPRALADWICADWDRRVTKPLRELHDIKRTAAATDVPF